MKGIYKVIFFVVISSLLFFGCKNPKSPQEKEVLPKKEVKVGRGDIYLEVAATGAVKPQVGAQVKVGARISGRVERLFVKQGDYVKKGELIAVIEHEEIKRQVERYQSVYKDALAQLEKVKLTYPERITAQKKTVQALQSELSQLEREAKRLEVLYKDGLISKTELERIERDREVKAYQLEAQSAQLKSLKLEYEKELEKARAQVEIARKQLEEAKVREQYAYIHSPISGFVSEVTTQQGETVVAGLNAPTFITVVDLSRLEVWCYIDETDIGKIKPGMEGHFRVDSFPEKSFKAKVRTIYPGAIIRNNVVFYIAVLDILDPYIDYLKPEMTAQVTILAGKKEGVIVIPSNAVKIDKQGKPFVYVKKGDKWEKRFVKTGWESRGKIEVLEGVSVGETIGVW